MALACPGVVIACALVLAGAHLGMRFPLYTVLMGLAVAAIGRVAVTTALAEKAAPGAGV